MTDREEIKSLIYKVGLPNLYLEWSDNFERFALAMYQRGAEDMRERAAKRAEIIWDIRDTQIAEGIRALPIGDSND